MITNVGIPTRLINFLAGEVWRKHVVPREEFDKDGTISLWRSEEEVIGGEYVTGISVKP